MECCTRQSGLYYDQTGLSTLRSLPLPPHQSHDVMNSTAPVPTYDVKRHYGELRELERNSLRSAMPFMLSDALKA